ncbi:hypothetical protein ERJ75_000209400 [Trypanosoma vivax]|uniref:Uncharacterized protein n=1 Tax=Trypanosoma vivax (strain Y486) TaxID=1055687 RepID=G0UA01_TRYVY|nr:hypothetical protein TRVL_01018 [Trypanosoma vivax]KAH8619007.1 hypothetical protein ERJ75_000209400 [Trypanosoma vivax]CCC52632.1 conserved hypothetical protein [Trypanosoma vivax Y486]
MLRLRFSAVTPPAPEPRARLYYSATVALRQLQARDRIISGAHGAGIINHQSMAHPTNSPALRSVTPSPPPADLLRTKVHEGTGTSETDPYIRMLPNQESKKPESSVLQTSSTLAPTVDELCELGRRWGTMGYWYGDTHPRLSAYLKQLLVPDVPPLSPTAESLLALFEASVVPKLASDEEDRHRLLSIWKKTVQQVNLLVEQHVFNRAQFETELSCCCEEALQRMGDLALKSGEGPLAVEALRRQALLRRNNYIEKQLIDVTANASYLGYGDAAWQVFFAAVAKNKALLLGDESPEAIRFAWEAVMHGDIVRLPEVTGAVALYLMLVCINESRTLVGENLRTQSANLDEGVRASDKRLRQSPLLLLHPSVKRRFVVKVLTTMLQTVTSNQFSKALSGRGLFDLSREVALCEAMNSCHKQLETDVVDAVDRFESKNEVKTLLSSLMGSADIAVRAKVASIFGIAGNAPVNWDAVMQNVDWISNWRKLATLLLSDATVLVAIQKHVKNAIGAKGVSKHLFSDDYAEQLQSIINVREERERSKKQKIAYIVQELSSFQHVDAACDILRQINVDLTELDRAAAEMHAKGIVQRPKVEEKLLISALEAVAKRHPNWVQAGVFQPTLRCPADALRWLMHMFIRLTYVPQAGAAAIARLSRRRIGPVGTEHYQHNIPAEVGFVEQYDNLQYKRYDWQGWYQRMVDVHNRNVSLRCRISDLRRLDAKGEPFVDMQTERRLRILAQDRVGMGVLKLDADKYEDQSDNLTFGTTKLSELLADARKARLGEEYWPSVELKVRRPSGQSKAYYSLIDYDRIEKCSKELYEKYRDAKKRSLFVTPMDMWLEVGGVQVRRSAESADEDGYTLQTLQNVSNNSDTE